MAKPLLNVTPSKSQVPVITSQPHKSEWLFSFKEFEQITDFGFSPTDCNWFAALFTRLREVSRISLDTLEKNHALKDDLRYHVIDWDGKGVPIARKDFTWVNKDVRDNEEEFPFYQFHVSKALGRVIGYWQGNTFNVLLLDPMHNMQPSQYNNYKIRPCSPVESDISGLLHEVDEIKKIDCVAEDCKVKSALMKMSVTRDNSNAVILFLDNDFLEALNELSEKHSLSYIMEQGILTLAE